MELSTGALSCWKCHWPNLKSTGFFQWNLFLNSLKTSTSTPLIIPHRLPAFLESLMQLKNSCSIHARCSKSSLKHSVCFCGIFSKFKTEYFIAYHSSKVSSRPDCIFEIHQLWQSGRGYSNCCCNCSFEAEIIKICQSSHKMHSNNSEFPRVYNNFKCLYKIKSGNLLNASHKYKPKTALSKRKIHFYMTITLQFNFCFNEELTLDKSQFIKT